MEKCSWCWSTEGDPETCECGAKICSLCSTSLEDATLCENCHNELFELDEPKTGFMDPDHK